MEAKILAKFEVRVELISESEERQDLLFSFCNEEGKYIGNMDWFKRLVIDREIMPETYGDNKVCSIGKSSKDGKWYGWSHRAIHGFAIGDMVEEGDCCVESGWTDEYLKDHPDPYVLPVGFEAKTGEDCKKMAIAFASSVS